MAHIRQGGENQFHVQHNARIVSTFPTADEAREFIKAGKFPKINEERLAEAQAQAAEKAEVMKPGAPAEAKKVLPKPAPAPKPAAKKKPVSKKK